MKSVLWRVAKCLSYIEEARCLKVNPIAENFRSVTSIQSSSAKQTDRTRPCRILHLCTYVSKHKYVALASNVMRMKLQLQS